MNTLRELHETLVRSAGPQAAIAVELGLALALVAIVAFFLRWPFSAAAKRQRAMDRRFAQLVKAHGLGRPERRLLAAMARSLGLDEAAMLFVRRSLFEQAAGRVPPDPMRLDELRRRLYSSAEA